MLYLITKQILLHWKIILFTRLKKQADFQVYTVHDLEYISFHYMIELRWQIYFFLISIVIISFPSPPPLSLPSSPSSLTVFYFRSTSPPFTFLLYGFLSSLLRSFPYHNLHNLWRSVITGEMQKIDCIIRRKEKTACHCWVTVRWLASTKNICCRKFAETM